MLITPELIDRLAETLEGIPMSLANVTSLKSKVEASILVYHSGGPQTRTGPLAGESPLLDINLLETAAECSVLVNSALGMVELHNVDEIRILDATEEVAFYSREGEGLVTILTLSSRGVIQIYVNIKEMLTGMELADISDEDLRAAVALKIFSENAEVFANTPEKV